MTRQVLMAIVEGAATILSDGALCTVANWDELGMPPVTRIIEQGPLQHGDSDIDFRLQARIFLIVFRQVGVGNTYELGLSDLRAKRARLLGIFKPRRNPIKLLWTLDDGSLRQIDCHFYNKLTMGMPDRTGLIQIAPVILRAANPLFYDPLQRVAQFGLSGGGGSGTIPLAVPMAVGASVLDQTVSITYAGDFQDNPVVLITGPIANPVITNSATGEKLDFTGYTLGAGASLTIDCRYGYKTVTDNAGGNQIAKLTTDSDLASFHLAADPDAPGGTNSIRVTGSGVTTATEVAVLYYYRFLGL